MGHNPRKRFGQNFLQDAHIIYQIINALNPQLQDNMLEIGPGLGALTLPLLCKVQQLNAIEIDRDLIQHLQTISNTPHLLNLHSADALTVDYGKFGSHLRIVGNLPYNISTPLLLHLLNYVDYLEDMHFMLQKEVVLRMAAIPGTKHFGRLSVILQYFFHIEYLFDVPPESFNPQPKVNSAIVRLTPYTAKPYDEVPVADLQYIVAAAFAMRRKTLNNNLKHIISVPQLIDLGIDSSKRPEAITVEEYVKLAKFISNQYKINNYN